MKSIYLKIFKESFESYLLYPLSQTNLLETALTYKSKSLGIIIFLAMIGFAAASSMSYFCGFLLQLKAIKNQDNNSFLEMVEKYYLLFVFVLSPLQYASPAFLLVCGFRKLNFYKCLVTDLIGKAIYFFTIYYLFV
jgi:membrane protein YqaA with SNARE-associated domain